MESNPYDQLDQIDRKNREISEDLTLAKSYTAHVRHQISGVSDLWSPTLECDRYA
jgi:hypothetical protein